MYDLAIIGGGPGGVAAGIYAARKKIKTILITDSFGGQSLVSADIQNWIGTKSISGFELGRSFEEHLRAQEDIEIVEGDKVSEVLKKGSGFELKTENGSSIESKTILVTTGSHYKKLGIPGEDKFDGKGISNCSTCDAPVFKDKKVAVIGGGNSGLEAVLDLIPYAERIYLINRGESLKGDSLTQEKIKKNPKIEIIFNAETKEFFGNDLLEGLKYLDKKSNEVKDLKVEGAFVKVGLVPNTGFLGDLLKLGKWGEIVVDHKTQKSSLPGIWAAGDASDVLYKQNNISAGDAIKAILNINDYLQGVDRN